MLEGGCHAAGAAALPQDPDQRAQLMGQVLMRRHQGLHLQSSKGRAAEEKASRLSCPCRGGMEEVAEEASSLAILSKGRSRTPGL